MGIIRSGRNRRGSVSGGSSGSGSWTTLAQADFEDGTAGTFSNDYPSDISFPTDPTGLRGGKVADFLFNVAFVGQGSDDVSISKAIDLTRGKELRFTGSVYLETYDDIRKLIRLDATSETGGSTYFVIAAAFGYFRIEGYRADTLNAFETTLAPVVSDGWNTLELYVKPETTVGGTDAAITLTVNGSAAMASSNWDAWDGHLYNASAARYTNFRFGEQLSCSTTRVEHRYWDDVLLEGRG